MAPTPDEIRKRVKLLPPNLQQAALAALESKSNQENHFHMSPAGGDSNPPAGSLWPGYLWYLQNSPDLILMRIAVEGRYWHLTHEERKLIRDRLGCTTDEINLWRESGRKPVRSTLTGRWTLDGAALLHRPEVPPQYLGTN